MGIDATVEEFGVGIAVLKICDSGALAFPSPIQHRKTNDPPLEPRAKVTHLKREEPLFLGSVKA